MEYVHRHAVISACTRYRYVLERYWAWDGTLDLWILLNPSTADGLQDDATVRRCVGFSKAWGASKLVIVNLYAFRATDPADLVAEIKRDRLAARGPENLKYVEAAAANATRIICAWGAHRAARELLAVSTKRVLWNHSSKLFAARLTKHGAPEHPVRLPSDLQPIPFTVF